MISRGSVIAALLVIELAISGEAVVAVRGGPPVAFPSRPGSAGGAASSRIVEGGPHQLFDLGAHPALIVDIGYADLTIVTSQSSAAGIDVSVSASSAYGVFRATAPVTARADGSAVRIATTGGPGWSVGDDRMVTVVVPPLTQVTVVNAGDIEASGLRAEASFKSVGQGSITIEDYAAPALHVRSSDGRIFLHAIVAERLDVKSSNDRVVGTALQVRDGSIESSDGVTLGFATGADTLVTAEANDGHVRVSGFTAPASTVGGRANSVDDDSDSSSQTVRVGAGHGHLDVHSSDGNIVLAQES